MANLQPVVLRENALAGHQRAVIDLHYLITGAKTGSWMSQLPEITSGYDAPGSATAALGQTTIDNLLGSTNEFVAGTAFGATAMGLDAFAFVLNLDGQAVYSNEATLRVTCNIGGTTTVDEVKAQITALPDTLAAPARMQVSSAGNVAVQFVKAGLDAATAGLIHFELILKLR